MKELLLNSIVSKAREFTTFSMNTGSDFDPWNLKSADSFVYSLQFANHFAFYCYFLKLTSSSYSWKLKMLKYLILWNIRLCSRHQKRTRDQAKITYLIFKVVQLNRFLCYSENKVQRKGRVKRVENTLCWDDNSD